MSIIEDRYGRKIDYLRISITDRCNFRCKYCMPEEVDSILHDQILSYEEILRICKCAGLLGVHNFKVTGGEPFVRKGCMELLRNLKELPGVETVTVTTNGMLLDEYLPELKRIGIDGVNISLDSLREHVFREITGAPGLLTVKKALLDAVTMGLRVKINCVLMQGINEVEIPDFVQLSQQYPIDVRFIELMPIGYGKQYTSIPADQVLGIIKESVPDLHSIEEKRGNGPAVYYTGNNLQGCIGIIQAISHKFCDTCNRLRLTSDGFLKLCLYYPDGVDLKGPLRSGASDRELTDVIDQAILQKPKEHRFGELQEIQEQDTRVMSGIGG